MRWICLNMCAVLVFANCTSYHVTLGGFSKHFEPRYRGKTYNEGHNNIGLGGEFKKDAVSLGATVQYVRNSFDNYGIYATAHLTRTNLSFWRIANSTGIAVGVASGYGDRFGVKASDIIPVFGLLNDICLDNFCVYQLLLPPYDNMAGVGVIGGRVHFSF